MSLWDRNVTYIQPAHAAESQISHLDFLVASGEFLLFVCESAKLVQKFSYSG